MSNIRNFIPNKTEDKIDIRLCTLQEDVEPLRRRVDLLDQLSGDLIHYLDTTITTATQATNRQSIHKETCTDLHRIYTIKSTER